ncbi:MAG TPA: hypothetical protein PKA64_00445 [Myxococcota bacterium]|nr:hypothetical protein [Myxococcota bacterium]
MRVVPIGLLLAGCGVRQAGVEIRGSSGLRDGLPAGDLVDGCEVQASSAEIVIADAAIEAGGRGWPGEVASPRQFMEDQDGYAYSAFGPGAGVFGVRFDGQRWSELFDLPRAPLERLRVHVAPVADPWSTLVEMPDGRLQEGDASMRLAGDVSCGGSSAAFDVAVAVDQVWSCPLDGEPAPSAGVGWHELTVSFEPWFATSPVRADAPRAARAWLDADTNGSGAVGDAEWASGVLDPALYDEPAQALGLAGLVTTMAHRSRLRLDGADCELDQGDDE